MRELRGAFPVNRGKKNLQVPFVSSNAIVWPFIPAAERQVQNHCKIVGEAFLIGEQKLTFYLSRYMNHLVTMDEQWEYRLPHIIRMDKVPE